MKRYSSFEKLKDGTDYIAANEQTLLMTENGIISFIELLKASATTTINSESKEMMIGRKPNLRIRTRNQPLRVASDFK